jgi:hypothetical protein
MGLVLNFTVSESLDTSDVSDNSIVVHYAELIQDDLSMSVDDSFAIASIQEVEDTFETSDHSEFKWIVNALMDEQLEFVPVLEKKSSFDYVVSEALDFLAYSLFEAEPYLILSLDTERFLPAIHSLPFFNSFVESGGEIYGSNKNGLFKLGGDTDNGQTIHTGVVWNKTNFGFPHNKRIKTAIIDGIIDNTVMQAKTTSGTSVYSTKKNRIPVGRKLYGRDWEIRLAEFERLESFELIPVLLRR